MTTLDEPRVYRLAPGTRRWAIYATVALAPAAAILIVDHHFLVAVGHDPEFEASVLAGYGCALVAIVVPFLAVTQRWALRVDERGIARRRFLHWDLWEWSDFASGRIRKQGRFTFLDPDRNIGHRTLRLEYMAEVDAKEVVGQINQYYELPPGPPTPDELRVKWSFRRSATFDDQGIRITEHGEEHTFRWNDVERLHITRYDPLRRDFAALELYLPDRELTLVQGAWRGAGVEQLNEFLLAHVPAGSVEVDVFGERPARRVDVERELRKDGKLERAFPFILSALLFCGFGGGLIWKAIFHDTAEALMLLAPSLGLALVPLCIAKEHAARRRRLESWLAEFDV